MPIHSQLCNRLHILFYILIYTIISNITPTDSLSPYFLTNLNDYKTGSAVITISSPTTTNGYDINTNAITFSSSFSQTPNVGIGLNYLSSIYTTTTNVYTWVFDITIQTITQSTCTLQLNRTTGIINQISLNYIAILSTSFL
jgi:hypothetical protein